MMTGRQRNLKRGRTEEEVESCANGDKSTDNDVGGTELVDEEHQVFQMEEQNREKNLNRAHEQAKKLIDNDEEYQRQIDLLNRTIEGATKYREAMSKHWEGESVPNVKEMLQGFQGSLRDYQVEGSQFLVNKFFFGESCILADDMGLGKTIQVIAFCCWLREFEITELPEEFRPILIAVPLSTAYNWVKEFERFAPHLPVRLYYGNQQERQSTWEDIASSHDKALEKVSDIQRKVENRKPTSTEQSKMQREKRKCVPPIVITNYAKAINDYKVLRQLNWGICVVDEGQCVKNPESLLKHKLSQLAPVSFDSVHQPMRLLLTGTPVGNDLLELWSLCNFVMPQVFVDSGMADKIYGFSHIEDLEGKELVLAREKADQIVSKLRELLGWYMLRRTKDESGLKLPPKGEVVIYCEPTQEQAKLAKAILDEDASQAAEDMGWMPTSNANLHFIEDADVSQNKKQKSNGKISLNNKLNQLRKVYNHPYLVAEPKDLIMKNKTDERIVEHSSKMKVLDKMLTHLKKHGHKVIIFSQYKLVLNCLEDYLLMNEQKFGGYRRLDGDVDSIDRARYMDDFNNDSSIFVFLASTRAGGLGVNLVGADTVVIFDSDWNPNQDSQAQDRVHRIGQEKSVIVYRLITASEVEKYMLRKHMGKKGLQRMILNEGQRQNRKNQNGKDRKEEIGEITEPLLRHWLKNDVEGRTDGISDKELRLLLDRSTALYAARKRALESQEDEHQANTPNSKKKTSFHISMVDIGKPQCDLASSGKAYEFVYQSAALEHFD
eukprot:gb/GECG01013140.1/.p1 GENE.gb/GECG01013140.1/~~gb/GECG01013140.1/.p1  ORF type:complete len:777 (+),score=121.34 gb/GECG01013140.1/:1-2331(+)